MEKNNNQSAFKTSCEVYSRLSQLFTMNDDNINHYMKIVVEYVSIKERYGNNRNGYNFTFTKDSKDYTAFTSFTNIMMFIEDLTMMIYRLYDGDGYNTYSLMDEIRRNKNE